MAAEDDSTSGGAPPRKKYRPTYLEDGRKAYDPHRTQLDIYDEWGALEEWVRTNEPDRPFPCLRARELWRQEEEAKQPYSEWQENVWYPRMRALAQAAFDRGDSQRDVSFTKDELERLVEHFFGANDPVAQEIHRKARQALSYTPSS